MSLRIRILFNIVTVLVSILCSVLVCQLCQRNAYCVIESCEHVFLLHSESTIQVFSETYKSAIINRNLTYSKIKIYLEDETQEFCCFIGKYLICDMDYTVSCRADGIKSVFDNYKESYEGKDIKHFYFTNYGYAVDGKNVSDMKDMLYWCEKEYSLNNGSFYILHIEEDVKLKKIWPFLVKVNQLFGERFIICKYGKCELNNKIDKNLHLRNENLPPPNIQDNMSL